MTEGEQEEIRSLCREVRRIVDRVDRLSEVISSNKTRIEMLDAENDIIQGLMTTVANLDGKIETIQIAMFDGFQTTKETVEKTTSFKNAMQFSAIILIPILLALIGLYATVHGHTVPTPAK